MSNWASMASCESDWTGSQPTLRLNSTGSSVNSLECEAAAGTELIIVTLHCGVTLWQWQWCSSLKESASVWTTSREWRSCWLRWWSSDLLVWSAVSSMVPTSTLSSASPVYILLVTSSYTSPYFNNPTKENLTVTFSTRRSGSVSGKSSTCLVCWLSL